MTTSKRFSILLLLAAALAAGCNRNKAFPPEINQLLRDTVEVKALPASLKDQKELQKAWTEMQGFYQKRNYQQVWPAKRRLIEGSRKISNVTLKRINRHNECNLGDAILATEHGQQTAGTLNDSEFVLKQSRRGHHSQIPRSAK